MYVYIRGSLKNNFSQKPDLGISDVKKAFNITIKLINLK